MENNKNDSTESLQRNLLEGDDLEQFIVHHVDIFNQNDFHGYLTTIQRRTPFSIKAIIDATYIDPSYCYQIFRGIRMPNRNKILQIAIVLQLPLTEVNRLLKLAGKHSLYIKDLRDTIIIHGFHKKLSLDDLECLLIEKGCDSLMD